MQTPRNVESVGETPASTNTVDNAVAQVVQAVAALAQGVTAEVKLCCAVTGHVSGGGCGGGLGGGSGGGDEGHEPIAISESSGTPSAMMYCDCSLMQRLSMAVSVDDTPCKMKGMATLTAQPLAQAVVGSAHGVAAPVKLSCVVTEQLGGGGGDGRGGGGGGTRHAARSCAVTDATG